MECKGMRIEDYFTFLKVGCFKIKTVPTKPDIIIIAFIQKAWVCRKINIEIEMKKWLWRYKDGGQFAKV